MILALPYGESYLALRCAGHLVHILIT
jgi:hypothetical protein